MFWVEHSNKKCCRMMIVLIVVVSVVCLTTSAFPYAESNVAVGIVGGNVTDITKVPYQAAALDPNTGESICGASVISKNHILLAGHCCAALEKIDFRVGSSDCTKGGTILHSKRVIIHPEFTDINGYPEYDACIVETQKPIKFGRKVQPLVIAKDSPLSDDMVMVAGWGVTETGSPSEVLRSVWVPVANSTYCQRAYPLVSDLNKFICAGAAGKDSCWGDSGSPLTWKKKLVGIVSFGKDCGIRGFPGVYTNVLCPEIRKFIRSVAGV